MTQIIGSIRANMSTMPSVTASIYGMQVYTEKIIIRLMYSAARVEDDW